MSFGGWLRKLWLEAQGVPMHAAVTGRWKNPDLFEPWPHECVVCGRAWRPDKPLYISLWGYTRKAEVLTEHWFEWYCPALNIVATTGLSPDQDQVRYLCHEHRDICPQAPDCLTGEWVDLVPPLSPRERLWQDVRYWSGCGVRFVWLLGQWAWLWTAYRAVGYETDHVRGPWPPLRVG